MAVIAVGIDRVDEDDNDCHCRDRLNRSFATTTSDFIITLLFALVHYGVLWYTV